MRKIAFVFIVLALLMPLTIAPVIAAPKENSPAWHEISVSQPSAAKISYDDLTARCLTAGLIENPYPAPTTTVTTINLPMYYQSGSEYRVFTFLIGDKVYEGVSYDLFDMTLNLMTGNGEATFDTVWYLGDTGSINHGFVGTIVVTFYNWNTANYYYTGTMSLKGFGHFTGQTAELTVDTRENVPPAGYLTVLGNRIK